MGEKIVSISKGAFAFCRWSIAILVLVALFFKIKWLVIVIFFIFLLSAIFKIQRAPLILIYSYTIDKIFPSKKEVLNEKAMRFAHSLGTVLSGICVLLIYSPYEFLGWIVVH